MSSFLFLEGCVFLLLLFVCLFVCLFSRDHLAATGQADEEEGGPRMSQMMVCPLSSQRTF